jgi:uncharacterized membrane protein YqjE
MADQASLKSGKYGEHNANVGSGNGTPEGRLVGGIAEFGNDIATLIELQYKLATIDLKESLRKALIPLLLMAVGVVFILGALPVLLSGVAELLAAALRIRIGWALLMTSATTIVLAGAILAICASRLPECFAGFRRSREEFTRNLAWLRTVLVHSGRSLPRRSR